MLVVFCVLGPRGLASEEIHTWNWYHFYLGAKYFDELGYTDLYEQTVVAQREDGGPLSRLTTIRELNTYRIVRTSELRLERSQRFNDARWREFKSDVAALVPRLPLRTWRRVLHDRGYNMTPTWDATVGLLPRWINLREPLHLHFVKWIDVVGLVGVVLLVGRVFGWNRAVLFSAAFLAFPPTSGRLLGGMVKYEWFFAVALAAVLLQSRRPVQAGISLGVAAGLRVFPALFAVPFFVRCLHRLLCRQQPRSHDLRVVAGFAMALAISLGVGAAPTGGLGRWANFADSIQLHHHEMEVGNGRIGLPHLLTHDLVSMQPQPLDERRANLEQRREIAWGVAVLLIGLTVLAWRRTDATTSLALAMVPLFALTVASHYYWCILALWLLVPGTRLTPRSRFRHWAALVLAFGPTLAWWGYAPFQKDDYLKWITVDACLLLAFLVVLVFEIVRRRTTRMSASFELKW